jgi:hypothetical protein
MSAINNCSESVYKYSWDELPRNVTPRDGRYCSTAMDGRGLKGQRAFAPLFMAMSVVPLN